jgi:uncharacterized protein HemX
METGEKEMRLAFEEVTTNNVKAILEHGNTTRKLTKELMDKIEQQNSVIASLNKRIDMQQAQITFLQAKVFAKGTD